MIAFHTEELLFLVPQKRVSYCLKSLSSRYCFVAFCSFFPCSLTGVDNKKVRVDNEKALELDNRIFFHILAWFNIEYHPKMQQNILLHNGMITPNILV